MIYVTSYPRRDIPNPDVEEYEARLELGAALKAGDRFPKPQEEED